MLLFGPARGEDQWHADVADLVRAVRVRLEGRYLVAVPERFAGARDQRPREVLREPSCVSKF